jgi:hypothetical protein
MPQWKQLRGSIQQFWTASLERDLIAACHRPIAFPASHSALEAAEGIFLAAVVSTFFWSLFLFALSHCR